MERLKLATCCLLMAFLAAHINAAPANSSPEAMVVASSEPSASKESKETNDGSSNAPTVPKIYQMNVKSNVSNRFAHTTITSKVKNSATKAQEATFSVVLPDTAFISGFIMEIGGKNYTAYVKEKEEAKKDYDAAVASGLGAAHVAVSARDSNRFTVSVNVEPETKAAFYLTYEELLQRRDGHYEQVINLHPGQPVKELTVEVEISESRKITDLKAPPLRSGNEIGNEKAELDPRAHIEVINDTSAVVKFSPNLERQKQLAHLLGTKEDEGLAGQFVVQYDVERDPKGGEVLIQDGYFVHFFAPTELKPLPKHVTFILDTSGSMWGDKIEQLKKAMHNILEQLNSNDLFTLIEFNSYSTVHDLDDPDKSVQPNVYHVYGDNDEQDILKKFKNETFPKAYPANSDNIKKAQNVISKFSADGGTEIYNALKLALYLVEETKKENIDVNHQPMIVFLTDGQVIGAEFTLRDITEYNSDVRKSPIFSLSFGDDADKDFLEKLSLRNSGFSKHIYEAADASLQLQGFYKQISSPLLANVQFKYQPSTTSLTTTDFPIHFGGSELVVAGWCGTVEPEPEVTGWGTGGRVVLKPTVTERSISSIERLWAYLTIQQLLEKKEATDKDQDREELKKKALDLALKHSFVTPVSSLVVVKPDDKKAIDTETADGKRDDRIGLSSAKLGSGIYAASPPLPAAPALAYAGFGAPQFAALPEAVYEEQEFTTAYLSSETEFDPNSPPASSTPAPLSSVYPESSSVSAIPLLSGPISSPSISISSDSSPFALSSSGSSSSASSSSTSPSAPPSASTSPSSIPSSSTSPSSAPSSQTPSIPDLKSHLLSVLSWLKDILNDNDILSLVTGKYKLGLDQTQEESEKKECPKTPLGQAGHCTLLHACPQVHSLLTSADVYSQYFCAVKNEFAGVCCPGSP